MSSPTPPDERPSGLRFSAWNLLLLVPLLMLITPWFNHDSPRLAGLPFFYWFQLIWVPTTALLCRICYLLLQAGPGGAAEERK